MLPQGRRAVAVRVIDQRLGQSKDGHFYERKVTLLSREDQIEGDFESQVIVVCLYSGICLCACTKKDITVVDIWNMSFRQLESWNQ